MSDMRPARDDQRIGSATMPALLVARKTQKFPRLTGAAIIRYRDFPKQHNTGKQKCNLLSKYRR